MEKHEDTRYLTRKAMLTSPVEKTRILVVEDHPENRILLRKILESIGLDVQDVVNGSDAVEMTAHWLPDLIWMDIRMPVMDGLVATKLIKASATGRHIKIVALSAHVLSEEIKEIFDAGCDDFVGKPYRKSIIFDVLKKHLELDYIYDEAIIKNGRLPEIADNRLDLSRLDAQFLAELTAAVAQTDAQKIGDLAGRIQLQDKETADLLSHCADNFDYETIKNALHKT